MHQHTCGKCGLETSLPNKHAGLTLKCGQCGEPFTVPGIPLPAQRPADMRSTRPREDPPKRSGGVYGKWFLIVLAGFAVLSIIGRMSDGGKAAQESKAPPSIERQVIQDASPPESVPGILPEVREFLAAHSEMGTASRAVGVPDWAQGKRQRVYFLDGGSLLFYLKSGRVVSVYRDTPSDGRISVWQAK